MIYVVIGLGLLFWSMGFILTVKNAPYLLSGYNTLSKEEQAKYDIEAVVRTFRKFHFYFAPLFLIISGIIYWLDLPWMVWHLALTPMIAYGWLMLQMRRYTPSSQKSMTYVGMSVLIAAAIFVIWHINWSHKPHDVIVDFDQVIITSPYGVTIPLGEIDSVVLKDNPPPMRIRVAGSATDRVNKGTFEGQDGHRYHLLIDKPAGPTLMIYRQSNKPVVISLDGVDEEELYQHLPH